MGLGETLVDREQPDIRRSVPMDVPSDVEEALASFENAGEDLLWAAVSNQLISQHVSNGYSRDPYSVLAKVYEAATESLDQFAAPMEIISTALDPRPVPSDEVHILHCRDSYYTDPKTLAVSDSNINLVLWRDLAGNVHLYMHETLADFSTNAVQSIFVRYGRIEPIYSEDEEGPEEYDVYFRSLEVPTRDASWPRIKRGLYGPFPVHENAVGIIFVNKDSEKDVVFGGVAYSAESISSDLMDRIETFFMLGLLAIDDFHEDLVEEHETDQANADSLDAIIDKNLN